MRLSASAILVSVAAAFLGVGGSAVPAQQVIERGVPQVSDDFAGDVAAQQPGPTAGEEQSCTLANFCDRFVNPGECDPRWSFTADAVVLQRTTTRNQPLFRVPDSEDEFLNAQHFDAPAALGFQLSTIRHGPRGWDLELGYFQIDGWIANATIPNDSFMVTGADLSGSSIAAGGEARYASALHLAELNVRRQWLDGLTLLVGFRMGELDESYSASGIDADTQDIILNARTFNHLYGFQLGADWECYNMGGPLRISALCKSGIYGNSASQSSRLDVGPASTILGAGRNQATFMGEAGGVVYYDVTCRLSFRASCQAMWIEGVALAPEQIGNNDFTGGSATINTHGGVFCYGGGLGMELKF
jgi:hypothetical protein